MAFSIKRNDREPYIQATLLDGAGVAVNLTTADAVQFIMRKAGASTAKVDAAAAIIDAANGVVRYSWGATDTDTSGVYACEWEVTWSAGVVQTFPAVGYDEVWISDDLG